jgi:ACS family hexuronate transporter-like MFS transporter
VLAGLRGLLGLAEGSANPAGMKATAEWFPAKERGFAGGLFNIGASVGSMLAPPLVGFAIYYFNWQMAFVLIGTIGLVWACLWLCLLLRPELKLSPERHHIVSGQRSICGATGRGHRSRDHTGATSGASLPPVPCRSTWGIATFWLPYIWARFGIST